MLAASAVALVVPGSGVAVPIAIFLLLLAPVVAESAARESLYGTGATVFAQPGVPRSAVGWKVAAVGAFVFAAGAPILLRSLGRGPSHGLAMLLGLVFTAAAAAGLGWLTGGGKLFLGAYTALWYVAIQRDSPLDFTGAFAKQPDLVLCARLRRGRGGRSSHRGRGGEGAREPRLGPPPRPCDRSARTGSPCAPR